MNAQRRPRNPLLNIRVIYLNCIDRLLYTNKGGVWLTLFIVGLSRAFVDVKFSLPPFFLWMGHFLDKTTYTICNFRIVIN